VFSRVRELSPTPQFLSEKIVILYQELLLNEFALMRSMELLFRGIPTRRGIYFISSFPTFIDNSNPFRSFDLMALTYALYNGVRRALLDEHPECGYELSEPVNWPTQCNIVTLLRDFIQKLNPEYQSIATSNSLEELAVLTTELIKILVNNGLLHIIFARNDDKNTLASNSPLHLGMFRRILRDKKIAKFDLGQDHVNITVIDEIKDYRDAVTLRNLANLIKFYKNVFQGLKISIDLFPSFFVNLLKILIKELKLDTPEALTNLKEGKVLILFKTAHGELTRLVYISRPLPDRFTNFDGKILPFVAEPGYLDLCVKEDEDVRKILLEFFERVVKDFHQAKVLTDILIEALVRNGYNKLTCYQYNYLKELFNRKLSSSSVKAVLTAPTGSGKTLIFLLYTVAVLLANKIKGEKARVVFIYPRKALATDQLQKFVIFIYYVNELLKHSDLNVTITIGIRDSDSLDLENTNGFIELRGLELEVNGQKLKLIHGLDANKQYSVCLADQNNKCLKLIDFIKDHKRPLGSSNAYTCDILVTNHSMFNKHLTEVINEKLQGNYRDLMLRFIDELKILVVDEAHIYLDEKNSKLLQSVFLKLYFLRSHSGSDLARVFDNIDMILSSATLTNRNILDPNIPTRSIIGVYLFPKNLVTQASAPSNVKRFFDILTVKPPHTADDIVYFDYYETLIPSDKYPEVLTKFSKPFKLRFSMFVIPYPYRSSWTSFGESLIAVLHRINALRHKLGKPYAVLAFIDSRESLNDIMRKFNERYIIEAEDHYDRILLTANSPRAKEKGRREAIETIVRVLLKNGNKGSRTLLDVIWDLYSEYDYFSEFHALTNYIDFYNLHSFMQKVPLNEDDLRKVMERILGRELAFCNELQNYAQEVQRAGGYSNVDLSKLQITPYYVVHHGALEYDKRREIENLVRKGDVSRTPYIVSTTSTLEVGVDFPNIIVTLQYGTDALPQEVQQRIGRSGRSLDTFYTSFGILIFRNTGDDLYYLSDKEIVDYVYNLEVKIPSSIMDDEYELARHITSILLGLLDLGKINDPSLPKRASEIMNRILAVVQKNYNMNYQRLVGLLNNWLDHMFDIMKMLYDLQQPMLQNRLDVAKNYIHKKIETIDQNLNNMSEGISWIANYKLRNSIPSSQTYLINSVNTIANMIKSQSSSTIPRNLLSIISQVNANYKKILNVSIQADQTDLVNIAIKIHQILCLLVEKFILTLVSYLIEHPGSAYLEGYADSLEKPAATIIPPGYIDPVSYTVDYFILYNPIGKANNKIVSHSFEELVKILRPLHIRG